MAVKAMHVHALSTKLRKILEHLERLQKQNEEALDSEQIRVYPCEVKLESLREQIDILDDAADNLAKLCDALKNYE